jgi:phosphomevalonate kinase
MLVIAPGKLVVLGEYAVVDGAPALVAAVNRGVACAWDPGEGLAISTPTGDDRFVRSALLEADAPGGTWRFTDWNPLPSATKVGLGGSAAAVVAATLAARLARGDTPTREALFRCAVRVHRAVQGSGSGIDVAASTYGGLCRFEVDRVTRLPAVPAERLVVVFSGTSASTGSRVQQYRAWPDRAAFVAESRRLVDGFATDPVAALHAGGALLRAMARQAGISYWTPAIDALVSLARTHGGAAKPSGAGGGDIVVALFPDPEAAEAYGAAAAGAGFLLVPVALAEGAARC